MDKVSLDICVVVYFIGLLLITLGNFDLTTGSVRDRILNVSGATLMVVAFLWLYFNFPPNNSTQTHKVEVIKKVESNGHPISLEDLPDGNYIRMMKHDNFAFVTNDDEKPFARIIFAVCSNEKIPNRFSTKEIRKEFSD